MARHKAELTNSKSKAAWIWIPVISLLAASLTYAVPSSASNQGISLYLSAPFVQGSHVTESVARESFDSRTTCLEATGVGTVTLSTPHFCAIDNAGTYGGATVGPENSTPTQGGTGTKYLSNNSSSSFVTFTPTTPVKYVGIWWSAGSGSNVIDFYDGDTLLQRVTTDVISSLISGSGTVPTVGGGTHNKPDYYGNPRNKGSLASGEPFAYLNLFLSGGLSATRIVISGGGFELDNLVTSTVEQSTVSPMVFVASSQTIAWSPTNTTGAVGDSPLTPNNLATVTTPASGGGAISYSVVSQGGSGCTVNSSTGVISYTAAGTCVVRATAAAVNSSPRYFTATKDVSFVFSILDPDAPGTPTVVVGDSAATITVVRGTGGPPTSYTVTSAPGGGSCTVTPPATSCRITGLNNGTDYTFSATATNTTGTSASSVSSTVVRPSAADSNSSSRDSSASVALPPQIESVAIRPSSTTGHSTIRVQLPRVQGAQRATQVEVRILGFDGKVIRKIMVPVNEGEGTLELTVNLPRGSYNTHALAINQAGTSVPVIARPDLIYRAFFEPSRAVGKPSLIGTKVSAAISFVPNSAKLSERSKADLREVAKTLIDSDSRVAVTGFSAKWLRGKTHEARLATARAYRVGKFLQSQGVDNWIYYYGVPSIETNTPQKNAWKSELRILPN